MHESDKINLENRCACLKPISIYLHDIVFTTTSGRFDKINHEKICLINESTVERHCKKWAGWTKVNYGVNSKDQELASEIKHQWTSGVGIWCGILNLDP